jgi:hypothetical protein
MKDVSSIEYLDIPEGVTVQVKARKVTVEGPRGTLTKNAGHIQMDIQVVSGEFALGGSGMGVSVGLVGLWEWCSMQWIEAEGNVLGGWTEKRQQSSA